VSDILEGSANRKPIRSVVSHLTKRSERIYAVILEGSDEPAKLFPDRTTARSAALAYAKAVPGARFHVIQTWRVFEQA
jgi:hypothetical protein